jgi:hypothetical protein
MEDERVPVPVGEVGLVADPAVDDVATELDAARLEFRTSATTSSTRRVIPFVLGLNARPNDSASRTASVSVPVSNSAPGIRP